MEAIVLWILLVIGAILFILRFGGYFSRLKDVNEETQFTKRFKHLDLFQKLISIYLILISPIIALVWTIQDIWPINQINDFQANIFEGYYYPMITFVIVWIPLVLVAVPFVLIYRLSKQSISKSK